MNVKEITEQESLLAFAAELLSLYFEKRDMDTLTDYIVYNTSWIGTGEGELCRNSEEAAEALDNELLEYGDSFTVADTDFHVTYISEKICVVYGTMRAIPKDSSLSEENLRLSVVLKDDGESMKLMHLHFSHADMEQEPGHFFIKKSARINNKSLRAEINLREQQLANLTKNIPGGVHQCANDRNMTLLSMSDGFLSMFGYSKAEIETEFGGKFIHMIYPGDREEMLRTTCEQLKKGPDIELEYRVFQKNGDPMWVLDKGRLMEDGNGGNCFYRLMIDITERKRQQEELRLSLERHKVILDQATDIIFEWDILQDTLDFSSNWKKRFGYDAIDRNISGRIPLSKNIHPEDMPAFVKIMKDSMEGVPYSEAEFRIRDFAGRYYWSRIRATVQYNADGRPIKAVGVIVDIDEEKKQKQKLMQQAHYDLLTGIYNKATIHALVEQRMQGKFASCKGLPDYHALMIIDVDYFKAVNDTYGHLCGDSVLSDVAAALKGSVRSGDLVGRIGGDEFLIYLPEVREENFVHHKAGQLMQALSCIRPEAGAPTITCSIGVAVLPRSENDFETLYAAADNALYTQKNSGRNGYSVYIPHTGESESNHAATAVGNSIVSDEGNVADEWLGQYVFRTLYESRDTEEAIDRLLEIIGRSFDVSRAYIFESSEDKALCSNTFEWCGEGVAPQMHMLQNLSYRNDLGDYLTNFNEHGIFYCSDIKSLHPDLYEVLRPQGIRSMLQCAMLDEGEFVGYVGFDECRHNGGWNERQVASFKLTADVLSTFLMKMREKQKNK